MKKKKAKGWEGEVAVAGEEQADSSGTVSLVEGSTLLACSSIRNPNNRLVTGNSFGCLRTTHTVKDPVTGRPTLHLSIKCTLLDIAHATYLRPEDVSFTLAECGLLARRKNVDKEDGVVDEEIVISRDMVEAVAKERGVKRMCMDRAHVLL